MLYYSSHFAPVSRISEGIRNLVQQRLKSGLNEKDFLATVF